MKFASKYGTYNVQVDKKLYENGRTALILIDSETGETVCKATVNLHASFPINDLNEVFIKDYAENEGVLKFLTDEGFVKDTGTTIQVGHTQVNVCKLLR